MAMSKVGVSIAEIKRLLDIKEYRTAWLMAHKIRKAMADRDAGYSLAGLVEMDDSFFGPKGTKRGRGNERKSTVLCAISLYRDRRGKNIRVLPICRWWTMFRRVPLRLFCRDLDTGPQPKKGRIFWRQYGRMDGGPMEERQKTAIRLITKSSFEIQERQVSFSRGSIG